MTKTSAIFGKTREVTELSTDIERGLWLAYLDGAYAQGLHDQENAELVASNTSGMFRLAWVCPKCNMEHRVEGDWRQVITAQQQLIAMGMAQASFIAPTDFADRLDVMRVEEVLDAPGRASARKLQPSCAR